ncbi:hypothetical protein ID875_29255 [Streptomyces globisporus]|uniref:Carrier domain-containing protein n=1 Tax=Streptomyces globisporus TaxID=1908 RepID=A0A927GPD4_STRGL|nr:hypothetical protein [Streptomyces globisporus]
MALAEIWRSLLSTDEVGPQDNFFSLGGHSLLVATLSARVRAELGVRAPLTLFLRHPVLRDLAAALPEPDGGRAPRDDAGLRQRGTDRAPLSAAQRRVWIDEQLWPGTAAYTVPEAFRLHGPLDEAAFEGALHDLMARHEALRVRIVGGEDPGWRWTTRRPYGFRGPTCGRTARRPCSGSWSRRGAGSSRWTALWWRRPWRGPMPRSGCFSSPRTTWSSTAGPSTSCGGTWRSCTAIVSRAAASRFRRAAHLHRLHLVGE